MKTYFNPFRISCAIVFFSMIILSSFTGQGSNKFIAYTYLIKGSDLKALFSTTAGVRTFIIGQFGTQDGTEFETFFYRKLSTGADPVQLDVFVEDDPKEKRFPCTFGNIEWEITAASISGIVDGRFYYLEPFIDGSDGNKRLSYRWALDARSIGAIPPATSFNPVPPHTVSLFEQNR